MSKLSTLVLVLCAALLLSLTAVAQDTPVAPAGEFQPEIMEIVSNTEAYIGSTVTLEGTITELVNVRLFVLDDGALLATNQVVVLNNSGQEYPLFVSADQRVRVTGIVHPRRVDGGLQALIDRGPMMTETMPGTMEATPQTIEATPDAMLEETPEVDVVDATPEMVGTPETADVTPETLDTTDDVVDVTPGALDATPETMDSDPAQDPMLTGRERQLGPLTLDVIPDRLDDWVIIEITSIENLAHIP